MYVALYTRYFPESCEKNNNNNLTSIKFLSTFDMMKGGTSQNMTSFYFTTLGFMWKMNLVRNVLKL